MFDFNRMHSSFRIVTYIITLPLNVNRFYCNLAIAAS